MLTTAASRLAELLLPSGARSVAFLGLSKNAGKTTSLVAVLEELARRGRIAGTTSAGRDGERRDAVTGWPKPRFRLWADQRVASAAATFASAAIPSRLLEELPLRTRFGAIEVRRLAGSGEMEVIGPSTASQVREACRALERAGAEIVLIDGAMGRRAFASARVADAVVLAVGMSAAGSLPAVLDAAGAAAGLIGLPAPPAGHHGRRVEGALTDAVLEAEPPRRGELLVVEDFSSVFLSPERRRRLAREGVALAARRPARLLAVTANPAAPGRSPVNPREFLESLRRVLPRVPLFDLAAGLAGHE